ncbi:MAG: VWA domain-containing protein, partial [Chlorobi bacterium]|nr:VWA domain-containing protein [Chlorobiota bacterium]
MNLKLISVYSPWFYGLCIALGLIYAFLLYYKYKRFDDINNTKLSVLFVLRFASVSFLAFLLLSPLINSWINKKEKPSILFVLDNSKSIINQIDTQDYYQNYLPQINDLEKKLSPKYDIKNYLFGEKFRKGTYPDFSDNYTNFSNMINHINDLYYKRNLGAVILVTDGNNNYGSNPAYAAQNLNFPIYSLALGDTIYKSDLILKNVETNDFAFLDNNFPLRINIQAIKLNNNKCVLEILNNNKVVYSEKIKITSQNQVIEKKIFLKATQVGLQKYYIKLSPVINEKNIKNNSNEIVIEVLNSKKKILILYNSPHPDISAIYNALTTNKNLEISKLSINDDLSEIDKFNLIVAHQLPSKLNKASKLIKKINKLNIPVLYIIGQQTDFRTLNSYINNFKKANSKNNNFEEIYPYFNDKFSLFKLSPDLIKLTGNLPPLLSPFNSTIQSLTTEILFFKKNKNVVTSNALITFFNN